MNSRTGRDLSLTMLVLAAICFFIQGLWANRMSRRKYAADSGVLDNLQGRRVAAARAAEGMAEGDCSMLEG